MRSTGLFWIRSEDSVQQNGVHGLGNLLLHIVILGSAAFGLAPG